MALEQNVLDFIAKASADYGKIKQENFSMMTWAELQNGEIKSPIEQIFYTAFMVIGEHYEGSIRTHAVQPNDPCALYLNPQHQIGKYRVDFLATYVELSGFMKRVVIELDGHEFHDKDKHQRAYEKARDRFISRQGLTILHFTGSELFKDPYKAVMEVLSALKVIGNEDFDKYDPTNPFGIE
jgi:very-short-patch-repair endonuclease